MSLFPARKPRGFQYKRQYGKRRYEMDFHSARPHHRAQRKVVALIVLLLLLLLLSMYVL